MEQIKIKISAKVKGKLMVLAHQKGVCSQIKMNFFAQNLREVSANLVKNFDAVFF
ncbi:hypothetical protein N9H73_05820 [Flavobacteriaceae bacterium]|nr:hypothetical protein [Flavobacteriaceae bacterium]